MCERTESDKKGGHLATHRRTVGAEAEAAAGGGGSGGGSGLLLRESAQCAPEDEAAFQVRPRRPASCPPCGEQTAQSAAGGAPPPLSLTAVSCLLSLPSRLPSHLPCRSPRPPPPLQDIGKHRYFNTNNLWLDLNALQVGASPCFFSCCTCCCPCSKRGRPSQPRRQADPPARPRARLGSLPPLRCALQAELAQRGGLLPLPLILNPKTLDPRDKGSAPVLQVRRSLTLPSAIPECMRNRQSACRQNAHTCSTPL